MHFLQAWRIGNQPYTDLMPHTSYFAFLCRVTLSVIGLICVLAQPQIAEAWGNEGHLMINRLAVNTLPTSVPAFFRTAPAMNEIEYLGPEPDRWRSAAEPELSAAQAADRQRSGSGPRYSISF